MDETVDQRKKFFLIFHRRPDEIGVDVNRIRAFLRYLDRSRFRLHVCYPVEGLSEPKEMLQDGIVHIQIPMPLSLLPKPRFSPSSGRIGHLVKAVYARVLRLFTDGFRRWAVSASSYLANRHGAEIDAFLTSYGPLSMILLGFLLKRRCPNARWVADLRDELGNDPREGRWGRWRKLRYETRCLPAADLVTFVSPILAVHLRDNRTPIPDDRLLHVANGFDFDFPRNLERPSVFRIVYTGSFYGDNTPDTFLRAVSELHQAGQMQEFELLFVGNRKPLTIPRNLAERCRQIGPVPYEQALQYRKDGALQLLTIPDNGRKGVVTGKIYDYLGTNRPILAFVPEDIAADMVRTAKAGYVVTSRGLDEAKQAILNAYQDWRTGVPFEPDVTYIERYHRKVQVSILQQRVLNLLQADAKAEVIAVAVPQHV